MTHLILLLATFLFPTSTKANWGLSPEALVDDCKGKAVAPCEKFRGRSNQTMGSAAVVIWKVGTKRIVTWGAATREANAVIENKMDFSQTLFAKFTACPMENDIPGHRIAYCIEKIENVRWVKSAE